MKTTKIIIVISSSYSMNAMAMIYGFVSSILVLLMKKV